MKNKKHFGTTTTKDNHIITYSGIWIGAENATGLNFWTDANPTINCNSSVTLQNKKSYYKISKDMAKLDRKDVSNKNKKSFTKRISFIYDTI